MKAFSKICWILTMVFGLGTLVLFFTKFATFTLTDSSVSPVGAQLAFGSDVEIAGTTFNLAKSADILCCFWLTVIGFVLSIFSFKSKKVRYVVPGVGLIAAVYMLVMTLSNPWKFVDTRMEPETVVLGLEYTPFVLIITIVLFAFTIASLAYLLIDDYVEVLASKGEKLTIVKRVVRFFRDYKSETKKIVWPGLKEVIKNTVIVLIMCLLFGALIWLVDIGLGKLIELILGV